VSGALPGAGHSAEFLANPALFMLRAWRECGELAEFELGGVRNILMVGPEAHEAVYRAPDDQLSTSEPYKYMVPVFGEGIQYGAPLPIERQQVKFLTHALRPDKMKGYARVIAQEVEDWVSTWGDRGERDFYDEFKELVLRTSTHCLMGSEFRAKLTEEFGVLFHDLEQAISPQAVLDAHSPDEAFAKRDRARARLQDMLMEVVRERRRTGGDHPDMLEVFMNARYLDGSALADELIPGMVVWIMFAGFHTSSNTASWTAVELARNPQFVPAIAREIDAVYRPGGDLSFAGLRELPALDRFIGEVLRLHPPLVTLMRQVMRDFEYKGNVFPPGTVLAISPYVSHPRARGVPRSGTLRSDAPAARERVRLDPVRRRPAQVRGQRVRAAPGAVDLLRAARALRVRTGRPARDLPRRDAVADPAPERAVPAPLPAPSGIACAWKSTSISVRATRCARARRRRSSAWSTAPATIRASR
jgi:sterol 14-demethylase